jgi:hypothetical protein
MSSTYKSLLWLAIEQAEGIDKVHEPSAKGQIDVVTKS